MCRTNQVSKPFTHKGVYSPMRRGDNWRDEECCNGCVSIQPEIPEPYGICEVEAQFGKPIAVLLEERQGRAIDSWWTRCWTQYRCQLETPGRAVTTYRAGIATVPLPVRVAVLRLWLFSGLSVWYNWAGRHRWDGRISPPIMSTAVTRMDTGVIRTKW